MVTEWLGADPRRCGWSPDRDRERPRAWDALLARLSREPPAHGVVKLQVTGPVTLAHALGDASLVHELAVWLAANAGGQVRALAERGPRRAAGRRRAARTAICTRGWVTPPCGTHCGRSRPPGGCTCAGRCRGTWSSGPSRTCSPSISRSRPANPACCGECRPAAAGSRGACSPRIAPACNFRCRTRDGTKSLLTPACGTGRMSLARELEIAARAAIRPERLVAFLAKRRGCQRSPVRSRRCPATVMARDGLSPVDCSRARWNVLGEKDSRRAPSGLLPPTLQEARIADHIHARRTHLRARQGQGRGGAGGQARRRRARDVHVQPAPAALRLGLRALPHDEGQPLGARGRPDGQGHRAVARCARPVATSTAGSCAWASATSPPPRGSSATT